MDAATPRSRARAPWGAAGMVAIVVGVEVLLAGFGTMLESPIVDMWADAGRQAGSAEVRESGLLLFGDSQVQQGVMARVVGDRLGVAAYSLAVPSGQPAAADALLRRALGAGARPRAVVVGFFQGMLSAGLDINERYWPELLGAAEAVDLAVTAGDARLAETTLLGLALPSYRAREQVRARIAAALRGEPGRAVEDYISRRTRHAERGSMPMPHCPGFADPPRPDRSPTASALAWRPSPANERSLRRFLARASRAGIDVYWLSSPLSPNERAARAGQGLAAGFDGYLRRLCDEFPNLVVLDAQPIGFGREAFNDPYHIDGASAGALSRSVADAIAAAPHGSRRVALRSASEAPAIARVTGPGREGR